MGDTISIGNKRQRYALQSYAHDVWTTMGFADTVEELEKLEKNILLSPSVRDTRIYDQKEKRYI